VLKPCEMVHIRQQRDAQIDVAGKHGLFDLGTIGVAQIQFDVLRLPTFAGEFKAELNIDESSQTSPDYSVSRRRIIGSSHITT
jgi:hypothetical protein